MKLVPTSLEESQNFERGLDPKTSMDIGMNRDLKVGDAVELISFRTGKPFDKGIILRFQNHNEVEVTSSNGSLIIASGLLKRARPTNETLNFERGIDPKKSMSIGLTRKIKEMLSHIHNESRQAELDYFDGLGWANGIQALKSILWTIYFDNLTPEEAFKKACDGWKITRKESKDFLKAVLNKELGLVINESLDFQRGIDPKASMKIGDAAILPELIDSNILQAVSLDDSGLNDDGGDRTQEEMDEDDKMYAIVQRVKKFIKGKVTFERYFDWKEEDEMIEFIQKNAKGRYVYNATPGQDGWEVVFSKIYFPRAEAIDI